MLSLAGFLGEFGSQISAVVITTKLPGQKSNLAGGLRMLRKSGIEYSFFKVLTNVLLSAWLRRRGLPVSTTDVFALRGLNPEIVSCATANCPGVIARIQAHRPEVMLAAGATHIFGNTLLAVPSIGTLNLHPSLLPKHAGVSPQFWALCKGDASTGATLHAMVPKLDAGPIIDQREFSLKDVRTVLDVIARIWDINNQMLLDFFREVTSYDRGRDQDLSKRSYRRNPTAADLREFHARGYKFFNRQGIESLVAPVRTIDSALRTPKS